MSGNNANLSETKLEALPLLTDALDDWFWRHGREREGKYQLPPWEWAFRLATLRRRVHTMMDARRQERPAMAVWGPSQTGKSTSVSAYMDAGARFSGDAQTDGEGSGLYWPGGLPFFFMAPRVADTGSLPPHMNGRVLNPFNKGMDGSACLSRFTAGSLKGEGGRLPVPDPLHPVRLEWVAPSDLMHALACGYGSECLGPDDALPTQWNAEKLRKRIQTFKSRNASGRKGPPDRAAFERLLDLCGVVESLANSEDSPFTGLAESSTALQSVLEGLFMEEWLLADPTVVDHLAYDILWDGCGALTELFEKMRHTYEAHLGRGGNWAGKELFCSLEAAGLFLNMGACVVAYKAPETNPDSPEAIIQNLIRKLSWREEGGRILISCDSAGGQLLSTDAEAFSVIQGLVWELVIPVNLENLPEHPFPEAPERPNTLRTYLGRADLLDFPGVGNDRRNKENRIILDPARIREARTSAGCPDASPQDRARAERCFTPVLFFKQIVKRGKTASIVNTYAKRLNMDGFALFQGLRGFACPNADQLISGVRMWWRYMSPEYYRDPEGESPLPLNLILTWWAKQLNHARNPNDSNIYGVIEEIVSALGPVRDPDVCTTFALHDHKSPDPNDAEMKEDFSPGSVRYLNILREKAFARQFQRETSLRSFREMLTDRATGGAEFFFATAAEQMRRVREDPKTNRLLLLDARLAALGCEIRSLLREPDLYPDPRPRDVRREHLKRFQGDLQKALAGTKGESEALRNLNYSLRDLLNIDAGDFAPVTAHAVARIDAAFIENHFHQWVSRRKALFGNEPTRAALWGSLGLTDATLLEETLYALVRSVAPDFAGVATWLRTILQRQERVDADPRRFLALRLGNLILYGRRGPSPLAKDADSIDWETFGEGRDGVPEEAPYYRFFLEPFMGPGGQLEWLAEREVVPVRRPPQPGDDALVALCEKFGVVPGTASSPSAS
ncbi:MAG: hypothetical protein JJT96_05665 [Opitutales bacterium]|nr:hypothetical protein [Opitutales bacterium]